MTDEQWFAENCGRNHIVSYRVRQVLYSGQSEFQRIDIVDTCEYGKMLFLDLVANSSQKDEFIYHETIVHPPLLSHPAPETVCIIGGAEGAVVREIFRHPTIKRVVMVDIDEKLVGLCKRHLPEWSDGAFEDPRLDLKFDDGRRYLEETNDLFDAILVDLSDPVPDSPAIYLFTREFYQLISDRLSENGVACFQGETLRPWRVEMHARMRNTLASVFPNVKAYPYWLPCFHELHSHILASKKNDPVGGDMVERSKKRGLALKYFSESMLENLFCIPSYVEDAYTEYSYILTDDHPYVMRFA